MGRDELGQRSETVRRSNLSAIVGELHADGPLSRSELVARTGLTRSAIRGLIGELVVAGLVVEERATPLGMPGRPSPLVHLKPDGAVVLGLEIAVDSVAVAVVGLGGVVFEIARVDRPRGESSVDETAADLARLVARVLAGRPEADRLIGIGVAVVGVVRRTDGFVSMAPNVGWIDVPLGQRLAHALDLPAPLSLANDADLGALAELRRGAARGADNVLFIGGGVGVGGGLIVDGKPLTGMAGYGGEVGHMPVNFNGSPCRCGSIGCWETEIGQDALLMKAGHPREGGLAGVELVLRKAEQGSLAELAALEHVGRWLGFGLAGLINVLNPGLIVLGGHFGRIHPFVTKTLAEELDRRTLRASRALVRIVPATLGVDAPLLGGAELAFEPLLGDPKAWAGRLSADRRARQCVSSGRRYRRAEGREVAAR
jgi:predicted NBD/HSP70 family sugar kinase